MGRHRIGQQSASPDASWGRGFVVDHSGWVITGLLGTVVGALVVLGVVFAPAAGHTGPVAPATLTAPVNPLDTPQARAYFAALYTDATIGPDMLSAGNALKLGQDVCTGIRRGDSLARSYAYVRDVTKLDKLQAARLVDAADRELCR